MFNDINNSTIPSVFTQVLRYLVQFAQAKFLQERKLYSFPRPIKRTRVHAHTRVRETIRLRNFFLYTSQKRQNEMERRFAARLPGGSLLRLPIRISEETYPAKVSATGCGRGKPLQVHLCAYRAIVGIACAIIRSVFNSCEKSRI